MLRIRVFPHDDAAFTLAVEQALLAAGNVPNEVEAHLRVRFPLARVILQSELSREDDLPRTLYCFRYGAVLGPLDKQDPRKGIPPETEPARRAED